MILREKCQEIDQAYEYRKHTDPEISMKCSEKLHYLYILLCSVEEEPQDNQQSNYVKRYLARNKGLTTRLVQIVADAEEMRLCFYALEILYTLSTTSSASSEENLKVLKKNLNTATNFSQLLESIYSLSLRFSYIKHGEKITDMQAKLLCIISAICEGSRCRDLHLAVSNSTVRFIGSLFSTCWNNGKLLGNLLSLLNLLCRKKKNCELLASSTFFDALCSAFKLSKKILTIVSILKIMSRNAPGQDILKKYENYQSLLEWFAKSQKSNYSLNKMTIIKAYTILNRAITKTTLSPKLAVYSTSNFNMTDAASSSEESDCENESEEDSEGLHESDTDISIETFMPAIARALDYLPGMQLYFDEIFNSKSTWKLNIFENIEQAGGGETFFKDIIEQRIIRNANCNRHSYPDSEMLEEEYDDHHINSSNNELDLELLVNRFKCSKGIKPTNFIPKIAYDLQWNYLQSCSNVTSLMFDSHFECGNLNTVIQTNELEYDLVLSPDTGSCRGLQWFYFQISNMKSDLDYTFNIVNFLKVNSQYNYGMQPLMFSTRDHTLNGIGWKRCGENIAYYGNSYTNSNGTRQYRTLSFSVSFKYSDDRVYLAYHYPYTYTRLITMLYSICTNNSSSVYKRVDKLCNTINNNEVPILTITAAANKYKSQTIPITERPIIFITSRVHPGETNSSWIAEGMIKYLLNETCEEACKIREYFIFKIIPMLNVEGVIYGNTRSGMSGSDLNRCWANPKQSSCSEIYYAKKLIEYVRRGLKQDVAACIDIHGHSRKKYFFFYGCNPKMSWNQEDWKQKDYLEALKVLPEMVSKLNPHIRLNSCRYRIERNRESTARVVIWREFGIQNSYTLECSYCSGNNNQTMDTKILTEIGASVISALGLVHEDSLKSI